MPRELAEYRARFAPMKERSAEIERLMTEPGISSDVPRLQALTREHRTLAAILDRFARYERLAAELADAQALRSGDDPEMRELAEAELARLEPEMNRLAAELESDLRPRSPDWDKPCIVEIRAAAGGEEAALFAGDLFRMYSRFAEEHGLKVGVLDSRPSDLKGYREVTFEVEGDEPYRRFRFESGVHRVQRIPETEASGRIHTSTVTVAVLPEAEEVEIRISPEELRVDVFRAGGHGGQGVNKTESAVRITHIPTGLVAQCQDERSQQRNKAKALKVLAARLLEARRAQDQSQASAARRKQIGTGERSEKIRTYNFPQNRVTDHRIGFSLHNLDRVLEGELDPLLAALEQAEAELE